MSAQDHHAVVIEGLRVVRGGVLVLPGIDLTVPRGTVSGLFGPSGCGKTTLMRAIVGTQRVASGVVRVLGEDAGSASLRPHIGYVTQAPSIYGDLTARENLRYFARVLDVPRSRVDEVIETVALAGHADRPARNLSGGQRARVSLGVALLADPALLVLDEPTVGLDPVVRRELWAEFARLAGTGATLLVSSHVMDEAAECGELVLMRDGRIVSQSPPAELLERTGASDLNTAFLRIIEAGGPAA